MYECDCGQVLPSNKALCGSCVEHLVEELEIAKARIEELEAQTLGNEKEILCTLTYKGKGKPLHDSDPTT